MPSSVPSTRSRLQTSGANKMLHVQTEGRAVDITMLAGF